MTTTLRASRSQGWLLIVCCLCLCVLAQMLGAPATLLSPAESADLLESSLLEGLSVLPPAPELLLPCTSTAAPDWLFSVHASAILSTVFHPPLG
jgi:hypothetical protein